MTVPDAPRRAPGAETETVRCAALHAEGACCSSSFVRRGPGSFWCERDHGHDGLHVHGPWVWRDREHAHYPTPTEAPDGA